MSGKCAIISWQELWHTIYRFRYLDNIFHWIDCKCHPCTSQTVIAFLCIPICTLNQRNSLSSAPPSGTDADQRPRAHCQLVCCNSKVKKKNVQLNWSDLFYLLTQLMNRALVAASATRLDTFGSRYIVQVNSVTFFFIMSLTSSQNITRTLNCDSAIIAAVAFIQRLHVTWIVVG